MNTTDGSGIFVMSGLEYLVLAFALIGMVLLWKYMSGAELPLRVRGRQRAPAIAPSRWFRVPEGFYFHPGHTWAVPDDGDVARVGMDDFAHKLLGQPEAFELPRPGTLVFQGGPAIKLRTHSRWVSLLSPVDGTVVDVNPSLQHHPAACTDDPYDAGWLIKVRGSGLRENLKNLLSGDVARSWMETVTEKLRRRLAGQLGPVAQDGGVPVTGFATGLPEKDWRDLTREFLLTD